MNRKKILALILLAALALTLTACGNGNNKKAAGTEAPVQAAAEPTEAPAPEPADVPAEAEEKAPARESEDTPPEAANAGTLAERVEAAVKDAADLAPFTADELLDMAGIAPEDCADFVFLQGDGMDGREILVIRATDEAAADRLAGQMQSYLQRRMDEMENYAPKAYQLLSAAKVQRKGLLLALFSGENAEAEASQILAGE